MSNSVSLRMTNDPLALLSTIRAIEMVFPSEIKEKGGGVWALR